MYAISNINKLQVACCKKQGIRHYWAKIMFFDMRNTFNYCLQTIWNIQKNKIIKISGYPWPASTRDPTPLREINHCYLTSATDIWNNLTTVAWRQRDGYLSFGHKYFMATVTIRRSCFSGTRPWRILSYIHTKRIHRLALEIVATVCNRFSEKANQPSNYYFKVNLDYEDPFDIYPQYDIGTKGTHRMMKYI